MKFAGKGSAVARIFASGKADPKVVQKLLRGNPREVMEGLRAYGSSLGAIGSRASPGSLPIGPAPGSFLANKGGPGGFAQNVSRLENVVIPPKLSPNFSLGSPENWPPLPQPHVPPHIGRVISSAETQALLKPATPPKSIPKGPLIATAAGVPAIAGAGALASKGVDAVNQVQQWQQAGDAAIKAQNAAAAAPPPTKPPAEPSALAPYLKYLPHAGLGIAGAVGLYSLLQQRRQRQKAEREHPTLNLLPKTAADVRQWADEHRLVAGFLATCAQDGLEELEIREKIAVVCKLDDDIADAFYTALGVEKLAIDLPGPPTASPSASGLGGAPQVTLPPTPAPPTPSAAPWQPTAAETALQDKNMIPQAALDRMHASLGAAEVKPPPAPPTPALPKPSLWQRFRHSISNDRSIPIDKWMEGATYGSTGTSVDPTRQPNPHWDGPAMATVGTVLGAPALGRALTPGTLKTVAVGGVAGLGKEYLQNEGVNAVANIATGQDPVANSFTGQIAGVGQPKPRQWKAEELPAEVQAVIPQLQEQARRQVDLQYPGASPEQKAKFVQEQMQQLINDIGLQHAMTQQPGQPGAAAPPLEAPTEQWDQYINQVADDPNTPLNEKAEAMKPYLQKITADSGLKPEEVAQFIEQATTQGLGPQQAEASFKAFVEQIAKDSPETLEAPGALEHLQAAWEGMPGDTKALLVLGLGLGAIGLLQQVAGGGGLGSIIMSLLGVGAAGLAGAHGGMFGSEAQQFVSPLTSTFLDHPQGDPTASPVPQTATNLPPQWTAQLGDPKSQFNQEFDRQLQSPMGRIGRFADNAVGGHRVYDRMVKKLTDEFGVRPDVAAMIATQALQSRGMAVPESLTPGATPQPTAAPAPAATPPANQPSPQQTSLVRPATLDPYEQLRAGRNPNLPV